MKRILAALVSAGLVLSGIALAPAAMAATSSATLKSEYTKKLNNYDYTKALTRSSVRDSAVESWILTQVNTDRGRNGVGSVKRNSSLDTVAYNWSKKMAAAKKMTHNPSVSSQIPSGWQKWGENVAVNGTGSDSGTMLYYQWMTSDGHRANILDGAWTDMGIGVYIDAQGQFWGTQVFAKYPAKSSSKIAQAAISGFSTSKMVKPGTTVTWRNVKLSNAGQLQKISGGKWVKVKNLAAGTHNISLKSSTSYGAKTSYRIVISGNSKLKGKTSATVNLKTQVRGKVTNFKTTSSVKRSKNITFKSVTLSHPGQLERYNGKKWVKVKNLPKGKQNIVTKAPAKAGKYKYRVVVRGTSDNTKKTSATVTVTVKR